MVPDRAFGIEDRSPVIPALAFVKEDPAGVIPDRSFVNKDRSFVDQALASVNQDPAFANPDRSFVDEALPFVTQGNKATAAAHSVAASGEAAAGARQRSGFRAYVTFPNKIANQEIAPSRS
jgi:hypothetical protein